MTETKLRRRLGNAMGNKGASKCPQVGICSVCSRNSEEARVLE